MKLVVGMKVKADNKLFTLVEISVTIGGLNEYGKGDCILAFSQEDSGNPETIYLDDFALGVEKGDYVIISHGGYTVN